MVSGAGDVVEGATRTVYLARGWVGPGQSGAKAHMPRMQPMQTARRRRRFFGVIFSNFGIFLVIFVYFY